MEIRAHRRNHRWSFGTAIRSALAFLTLLLFIGCGQAAEKQTREPAMDITSLLGDGDTQGYARAESIRQFIFPQDHGPHPEFRTEWWYYTGNLTDDSGERYGFQLTFFRIALSPPQATERESAWTTNQVYMAHFAITDTRGKTFQGFERFSRAALGLAGAEADPFRVWLEGWEAAAINGLSYPPSLAQTQTPSISTQGEFRGEPPLTGASGASPEFSSPSPMERGPGGEDIENADTSPWRLEASENDSALSLVVKPLKGIVLQGDRGLSQKGSEKGNASYYHSITRLEASGILTINGAERAVAGTAWFDHEWGTSALGEDQAGWDWFALQFDDGSDLMYYRLRQKDGGTDPHSEGTIVDPAGNTLRLAPDDVSLDVLDSWRSPSGTSYPIKWRARVEPLGTSFIIRAVIEAQEQNLSVRYWEGAVDILNESETEPLGRGYMELTGYAGR